MPQSKESSKPSKPLTGAPEFIQFLFPYQKQVEQIIQENIEAFGPKNTLRDACEYALLNGGKRFRPALVLMLAKALNKNGNVSQAALAIEYFHTASLVVDDLPCMDDDDERRNKPTAHKIYGEAMALLVSYGLIAAGYECIAKNAEILRESSLPFSGNSDRIAVLALQNSTYNTGFLGATGGQFLDILPPDESITTLRDVIHKKTVSLFEVSFVFGWLFGGGVIDQLELVKKAAGHFGMAFQIVDDLGDMEQDLRNKRIVNMAIALGKEAAFRMFMDEIDGFFETMQVLGLDSPEFKDIGNFLIKEAIELNHA